VKIVADYDINHFLDCILLPVSFAAFAIDLVAQFEFSFEFTLI